MKDIINELWKVILQTIWLALVAAAILGAMRLMAWADTGMKGGPSIEERLVP